MDIYNELNIDLQERVDKIINNRYKKNNKEIINQVKYMKGYYMLLNNYNTFQYEKQRLKFVFINIIPKYLFRYAVYSMEDHKPILLDNDNHYNNTLNTINRFIDDEEGMDYYELYDSLQIAIISYYKDIIKGKIINVIYENVEDYDYMEKYMWDDINIIKKYIENYFNKDLSIDLLGIAQLP